MSLRAGAWLLLVAGVLSVLVQPASAQEGIFQGMQKGVELTSSSVSTTTTFASGLIIRSETKNIFPSFRLNMDTLVYPSLRLNAGGVFELNMVSTNVDGGLTESTISRNRPYFLLRSTNPVFSPGFGYFRREDRARTGGLSDVKLVNDEYDGYLGWNPEGGPKSEFQFIRSRTFDGARAFENVKRTIGSVTSNYAYGNFGAYYRGSYLDTNDEIVHLDTTQTTHAGRVSDSGAMIHKRFLWNATYNINHQNVKSATSGNGGEIDLPITPFAGLAALSDTPVIGTLSQNTQIIDGNLTASAGINIGLVTPPADTQARNIGLDFLNPTEVNRFLIWADRDLPVAISNSFSWEIYTSTDNVIWTRQTVVSAAPFGPFENRFELVFPSITARYIKVVTRPVSIAIPDSSRFPEIFVTEMQAFIRRPAGRSAQTVSQTSDFLNTDWRMRIVDAPSLFYEGFYLYNRTSGFGRTTTTLSNGVSISTAFARVFSAYARVAREQGTEFRGDRVATISNATLTIDPIPTFRSSLLYTGQDETVAGLPNDRRGLFVQNAAQVYHGVDVLFGFGWNVNTRESGETSHDRLLNASATIVPRQSLSFTFSYDETATERSGVFVGNPHSDVRRVYAAVAIDPISTFHLVLGEEVITVPGERTRTTLDVGVNWTPFRDGALQFIFAHNEALRALEFGTDRSTLGVVRWNLSRRSFLDVQYQRTRSDFVLFTTQSRIFSITVRLFA